MDLILIWVVFSLIQTLFYLMICSKSDLKTRKIPTKLSIAYIIYGLAITIITTIGLQTPLILALWIIEMSIIAIPTFILLKKGFGGGDFWMLLSIQSNNVLLPIPFVSLLVHAIAGTIGFMHRKKWEDKEKTIPFAPLYLSAYSAISIMVLIILFLL